MVVRRLARRPEAKFLLVGSVNTALTYACYAVLIALGAHFLIANTVVYVIGIAFGYVLNKRLTFQSEEKVLPELARYVAVYIACFLLGSALLYFLVHALSIDAYSSGAINALVMAVVSWFGHRYFSFRAKREEASEVS
jgi:putative flippase GtrA